MTEGSPSKAALPVAVTEHDGLCAARILIGVREPAAGDGGNVEGFENAIADLDGLDFLRAGDTGDVRGSIRPDADRLKGLVVAEEGEVHGRRELQAGGKIGEAAGAGRVKPEGDELVGVGIRKRAQQDAVDDAEDDGIGADADGEGEQNGDGESGGFAQAAEDELEIGEERLDAGPLPGFAAALLDEGGVAEGAAGGLFGLRARHAFFHEFVDLFRDVFLDGDGEVIVAAAAGEQRSERAESGHGRSPQVRDTVSTRLMPAVICSKLDRSCSRRSLPALVRR